MFFFEWCWRVEVRDNGGAVDHYSCVGIGRSSDQGVRWLVGARHVVHLVCLCAPFELRCMSVPAAGLIKRRVNYARAAMTLKSDAAAQDSREDAAGGR